MTESKVPALRFSEFSQEWNKKNLLEISSLITKGTTPKYFTGEGINFIKIECLVGSTINKSKCLFIDEEIHIKELKRSILKEGDILFAIAGATIGKCSIVTKDILPANTNQALSIIRLKDKDSLSFVYNNLRSDLMQKYILDNISVGAQPNLNLEQMGNFSFFLPSLPEQQKIASFLTAIDAKIELLTKKKALLEQYKKGVMQQLFTQQVRFKDEEGNDFPDWEEKTLGEVCRCLDNYRKPLNDSERQKMQGEYPYWGANNIMDYIDKYIFDDTIVLLAEDGGNFNDFKNRPIANLYKGKCWVNNHTHVLKGKKDVLIDEYLFYSIVHKDITGFVSGGTRSKLTKGEMFKITISCPSLDEQNKIVTFLKNIDTKIRAITEQVLSTQAYKKGLLQQLFV